MLIRFESYRTTGGTCCKQILFRVSDDFILTDCKFIHGCSGLSQTIARLCIGMHIDEIIKKLQGITCKGRTSCPDQLTLALKEYKENI